MEKKKGFMSFMKNLVNKEDTAMEHEEDHHNVEVGLESVALIDPEKPYYAMLLVNSYLQFSFVFERVTNKEATASSMNKFVPAAIEKLAVIVKDFESTLRLDETQIGQLTDSINLIEEGMKEYFSFKEKVDSIEDKLKVLAPMAYGEKYQIDGLVRSGELFNPASCDRYMQSIPKIASRIEFINQTVHKLEVNEALEDSDVTEINKWFKSATNFNNVVDSDISTIKEILLEART